MITLDAVRAAVLADQPWSRLDDLVRAEMAAGRKVKEIAEELVRMADAVWDTPGLSDDGSDAFGDTIDALTGNCRSDQCYYDLPSTSLPTDEEIAKLPRWVRVAFAVRCARRALPVFYQKWPDAPSHYSAKLVGAVETSESCVVLGGQNGHIDDYAVAATLAAYVADAAINAAKDHERAAEVIDALTAVLPKVKGIPIDLFDAAIVAAVHNASIAIANGIATGRSNYAAATVRAETMIRMDFDHILRLAEQQHWDDNTPVSPDMFGPLWPEGVPAGWPIIPHTSQHTEQVPLFVPVRSVSSSDTEDSSHAPR